jgi:hypothetical protein
MSLTDKFDEIDNRILIINKRLREIKLSSIFESNNKSIIEEYKRLQPENNNDFVNIKDKWYLI